MSYLNSNTMDKNFLNKLRSSLEMIAENHYVRIDDFYKNSELDKSYKFILNIINHQRSYEYLAILDILKTLYRPTNIKDGTGGSFLFGCFQGCYGKVGKICSILCINSIPSKDMNPYDSCQNQLWSLIDGSLIKHSNIESSRAYIYTDSNFKYFKPDHIKTLRHNGIYYVSVLITENSKHQYIIKFSSVDDLPVFTSTNTYESIENDISNTYKYLIVLLLFILLGVIFYSYIN